MKPSPVPTFFYGSFINLDVLAKYGVTPKNVETVELTGFDIEIAPLANLVWNDEKSVHGILTMVTHADLETLYSLDWVGRYYPYPVVVETQTDELAMALCYIAFNDEKSPPTNEYVMSIITAAEGHGFPQSYIERLESFRPVAPTE